MKKATEVLLGAKYVQVPDSKLEIEYTETKAFEDLYGVVVLSVWESWEALQSEWLAIQSGLVDLISKAMSREDRKAWDGYLVLLLPEEVREEQYPDVIKIRQDTSHVRKIVGVGNELESITDVERVLSPLLPLGAEVVADIAGSPLQQLTSLLEPRLPPEVVQAVTNAFIEGKSILDELHHVLGEEDHAP